MFQSFFYNFTVLQSLGHEANLGQQRISLPLGYFYSPHFYVLQQLLLLLLLQLLLMLQLLQQPKKINQNLG